MQSRTGKSRESGLCRALQPVLRRLRDIVLRYIGGSVGESVLDGCKVFWEERRRRVLGKSVGTSVVDKMVEECCRKVLGKSVGQSIVPSVENAVVERCWEVLGRVLWRRVAYSIGTFVGPYTSRIRVFQIAATLS